VFAKVKRVTFFWDTVYLRFCCTFTTGSMQWRRTDWFTTFDGLQCRCICCICLNIYNRFIRFQ